MDNIVTVLNKDEQFAIYWCFSRAMDYVEKHSPMVNPYPDSDTPIVTGKQIGRAHV